MDLRRGQKTALPVLEEKTELGVNRKKNNRKKQKNVL